MGIRVGLGSVIVAGVVLAGCGGSSDDPPSASVVTTEDASDATGDAGGTEPDASDETEPAYVEVDATPLEVPDAELVGEVALPEGVLATDADRVVAWGTEPWIYRNDVLGGRRVLEQVDGATGAVLQTVEIPVFVAFPDESQVDGEVLWLPVRHDEGGGQSSFGVIRFDLGTGAFTEVPTPSYVDQIELGAGTASAVMAVGDTIEVHDLSKPDGDPDPTVRDAEGEDDGRVTVPAADGIYDCGEGSWGFTPLGTDERVEVDLGTTGCNALAFSEGLAVTTDAPIRVLSGGRVEREVAVPGPVSTCSGPDQADASEVVMVCSLEPYENNGLLVVRMGSDDEVEVLEEVGTDPRRGLGITEVAPRWEDGGILAAIQQPEPDPGIVGEQVATYVVSVTDDEVTVARGGLATIAAQHVGDEIWLVENSGTGVAVGHTGQPA